MTADPMPAAPAFRPGWPSVDGTMSATFFGPAAFDCTGFVAPSYAVWLTDPPHGAPPSGRSFIARGPAVSASTAPLSVPAPAAAVAASISTPVAAPIPVAAPKSSPESSALPVLSFAPLPPKRLAERPVIVLASLAPLPPKRLAAPAPVAPVPAAAAQQASVQQASAEDAASDDAASDDAAAPDDAAGDDAPPAEDAARAIDDAPEPTSRATSDRAPAHIEILIERYAERFNVPAPLVRRVAWRESKFDPSRRHGPYWGLMQIRVDTARALGFRGAPSDLLEAETNMAYAVAYLANAYRVAGRDEKRAVMFYAKGYYYEAKRKGMLGSLIRTAAADEPSRTN